jgi:hypothetical protein
MSQKSAKKLRQIVKREARPQIEKAIAEATETLTISLKKYELIVKAKPWYIPSPIYRSLVNKIFQAGNVANNNERGGEEVQVDPRDTYKYSEG